MITAIDSSVIIDILSADAEFGAASRNALKAAVRIGRVVACDVVWAEVAAYLIDPSEVSVKMSDLIVEFSPVDEATASLAGARWREYREKGGPRSRILADFLIGAHALLQADRLLTRDHGFHRSYAPSLVVVDPSRV